MTKLENGMSAAKEKEEQMAAEVTPVVLLREFSAEKEAEVVH